MIDFPNNPALGATYTAPTGVVYQWNGTTWVSTSSSKFIAEAPADGKQYARQNKTWAEVIASGMWVGDVPPTDPVKYPQWWRSTDGILYVWYNDGNSSQWVVSVPTAAGILWGAINGDINLQLDLKAALDGKTSEAPNDGKLYGRKSKAWADASLDFVKKAGDTMTGDLTLGSGKIVFPAVQQASPNANTLDDYREGTVTGITNTQGVAITVAAGSWVKVGRVVTLSCQCSFAANSNGTNVILTIAGIPPGGGMLSVGYPGIITSGGIHCFLTGANDMNVYAGNAFATYAQMSNAQLYFGGSYIANS